MKRFLLTLGLPLMTVLAHANAPDMSVVEKTLSPATRALISSFKGDAMKGDYQAMRNIAFTWSTDGVRQNPSAAVIGCAWYAQIMEMHKAKVHEGDASNRALYCGRLSRADLQDAATLSSRLGADIKSAKR